MSYTQPSFLGRSDLEQELAIARHDLTLALDQIRDFSMVQADAPWLHLEHLLGDLRAAAITVSALERTIARMT